MLFLLRRTPVKTLKHLPKFLPIDDDFKNTELISDDEHEKLRLAVSDVKNQLFVETATWGLSDWERVLGISVKENAGIEDRRIQILLKLQGANTVSETFMNNLINIFCENKSGYIIQYNPEYWFELCVSGDDEIKWKELLDAVNTYKPAHLGFAIVIRIISQILTSHRASIIQYINANHNFWNLGTAEKVYWDGIWNFNNNINWSGENPNLIYKDRQTHSIFLYSLLTPNLEKKILSKLKNKQYISSIYSNCITHDEIQNNFINAKENLEIKYDNKIQENINANQNHITDKNCWDGSFCLDGSHILSGTYEINKQMENICVFYSTKHGIVNEGSREIL